MSIRILLVLLFALAQSATALDRAYYEPDHVFASEVAAALLVFALGYSLSRRRVAGEWWCFAAAVGSGAALLGNTSAAPGLPRVISPIFGTPIHLLPVLAAMWTVGLVLVVARRIAGRNRTSKVYCGVLLGLGGMSLCAVALQLRDFATLLLAWAPLALVSLLHLRRPGVAIGAAAAATGSALLAGPDLPDKLLARWASTWWGGDPFNAETDQVARMLWGLAAGGWWGRGGAVQPPDYRRWTDDSWLAFLAERHGAVGVAVALLALAAAALAVLRIASQAASWRPEARALPLAALAVAAVPTLWVWLASNAVLPITGVSSPLVYTGGANMALGALLLGLIVGTPAEQVRDDAASLRGERLAAAGVAATLAAALLAAGAAFIGTRREEWTAKPATTCDGHAASFEPNPRLTRLAEALGRRPILDRFGLPLAVDTARGREYPFGEALAPYVGEVGGIQGAEAWRSESASYPRAKLASVCGPTASGRDYSELMPVFLGKLSIDKYLAGRDAVRSTVDAQLGVGIDTILARRLAVPGAPPAAIVVVLDGGGGLRAEVTRLAPAGVAAPDAEARLAALVDTLGPNLAERLTMPPGSSVKPLVAELAIELGVLPRSVGCYALPGEGSSGARRVEYGVGTILTHDHASSLPHGQVTTLDRALGKSCNCYFAEVGARVGADAIEDWYEHLGFSKFAVADNAYGATRAGFGQGIEATPRELADAYLEFTGGAANNCADLAVGEATDCVTEERTMSADKVYEAMLAVVSPGGTGVAASTPFATVRGKTGTADWDAPGLHRTASWFAGIASIEGQDRVVVVAVPESGGRGGGEVAAPIFKEVVELIVAQEGAR